MRRPLAPPGRRALRALLLSLSAALAGAPGCAPVPASVSGTVTLNNEPVSGVVVFVGPDGKEEEAPIAPDGEYVLPNAPLGRCKVKVKGFPGISTGPPPKAAVILPDSAKMGPPPPARYADPDNGLTYEVRKGKQRFDIPLTP
jgi:hypothetical protein